MVKLFVLFCVGIVISLFVIGVTYVISLIFDDGDYVSVWLFSSLGFGLCLTIILYQNGWLGV